MSSFYRASCNVLIAQAASQYLAHLSNPTADRDKEFACTLACKPFTVGEPSETNIRLNELIEKECNIEESLKNNNNTLVFTELKQILESFLSFRKLTPEILHRPINRIEIKAEGFENLLQILEPFCLIFNPNQHRHRLHMHRMREHIHRRDLHRVIAAILQHS